LYLRQKIIDDWIGNDEELKKDIINKSKLNEDNNVNLIENGDGNNDDSSLNDNVEMSDNIIWSLLRLN